ncbi:MAG: hypothetical protein KME32_10205 [Mojavia pulchra JT2-VF2]|uniref:Uncharacterized protein n=1 Tax=Mojavia pulchra JT2-VF2 TaxID=287848 RepID=A0A951PYD7_9NOST|nr:hypothetical protein [Mojavia pulchra JT2-VF2]
MSTTSRYASTQPSPNASALKIIPVFHNGFILLGQCSAGTHNLNRTEVEYLARETPEHLGNLAAKVFQLRFQ